MWTIQPLQGSFKVEARTFGHLWFSEEVQGQPQIELHDFEVQNELPLAEQGSDAWN